jgi:hypothetical protein
MAGDSPSVRLTIVQYLAVGNDLALLVLQDARPEEGGSEYFLEWDVHGGCGWGEYKCVVDGWDVWIVMRRRDGAAQRP